MKTKTMIIEDLGKCKILMTFPIGYIGWEMDNYGWVVQDTKGKKHLVRTNHGSLCVASKSELNEKMTEYKAWIKQTKEALELLK